MNDRYTESSHRFCTRDAVEAGAVAPLPDSHLRRPAKRFVRNRNAVQELESLRLNLIAARVHSGLTAVEGAEAFGYSNSTQLSLIESGQRPVPRDWKFLRQAADIYGVSTDFLLDLSPHLDFDAKVVTQYALMRRTEDVVGGIASLLASALVQFSDQEESYMPGFARLESAVARVDETLMRLRERYGFDDVAGGAPLLAAVEELVEAAEPVRQKLRRRRCLESYLNEVRAGKLPAVPHLMEQTSRLAEDGCKPRSSLGNV